jgi:hypothetical protein
MHFSIFEIIMLVCFGISWPAAIVKTLKCRSVKGVSPLFYWLVLTGYVAGTIHKLIFSRDIVIFLYIINCMTVLAQTILYYYHKAREV